MERFSEDELPYQAFKDTKTEKAKKKTKELSLFYDKWIEEAQKGMIDLYKEIETKYDSVAERVQNIDNGGRNKNLQ